MDVQKMTEEELQAQCVAWRRWFHEHPEVSTRKHKRPKRFLIY